MTLAAFSFLGSVTLCVLVGYHVEHWWASGVLLRRASERLSLWCLRAAGIWIVFWFLFPVAEATQSQKPSELALSNTLRLGQVAQQIQTIEARIAIIEALRLDARLALLEDTRDDVRTMRTWMLGVLGGVIVIVVTQVLGLISRGGKKATDP